jgi:hypothetical protein
MGDSVRAVEVEYLPGGRGTELSGAGGLFRSYSPKGRDVGGHDFSEALGRDSENGLRNCAVPA